MHSHKLKIHIATTLFFSLVLSMLLINIVILVFWYQHLIQQKILQSKSTISQWSCSTFFEKNKAIAQVSDDDLLALQKILGTEYIEILFATSADYTKKVGKVDHLEFEQFVKSALLSNSEHSHRLNYTGVPPLFAPKLLATVFLQKNTSGETVAIGALIDTLTLLKQIWSKESFILSYVLFNALVLTTIAFFRIKKILLNPVEKLVAISETYQVAEGGGLFLDHTENEIGQLARAMGNMVQRIEVDRNKLYDTVNCLKDTNKRLQDAHHEIIHAEKLAAAGRLSAGLAHEIGNPVAIVQGYLELLQDSTLSENDRLQFTGRAINELQRISKLLRQLIDMTRNRDTKKEIVYPGVIVSELLEVLSSSLNQKRIIPSFTPSKKPIAIWADRELFRQVVLNCLLNSIDAVSEKMERSQGGKINITINVKNESESNVVCLEIQDNGVGIEENKIDFIFEPFFTTKDPGKGTGLGLAVSYRIIKSLGGKIEVESHPGNGAIFRILMPLYLPGC